MPDEKVVLVQDKGHIRYITLNRPDVLNAVGGGLGEALGQAWLDFDRDDDAWIAVITGAGRAFCAGADLREVAGGRLREKRKFNPVPGGMSVATTKPVIAAINGYAIAGGWLIAQNCDIRIASETALMGIAEVKWNLPAGWIVGLPKIIGLSHSLYLGLTALNVTAQRAYEMGFVQKVVPPDKLMEEATALAEHLCKMGQQALRIHKRILWDAWNLQYDHASRYASGWMQPLQASRDALEGAKAFTEGRQPQFEGR